MDHSYRLKKGLDLPLAGAPEQVIEPAAASTAVALLADDHVGLKPAFRVAEGDAVQRGQLLFEDRATPGVRFTAPPAPEDIEYSPCGPAVMNNTLTAMLLDLGVDRENIMFDDFGL